MKLRVITEPQELKAIREGWLTLLKHPRNHGLHQDFQWFWIAYQAFHQKDELYVLTLWNETEELSAIAPLVVTFRKYRGIRVRKIGFAGNDQSPSNDFILAPGSEELYIKAIMDHLWQFLSWEFIDLQLIDVNGPTGAYLQKILESGIYPFGSQSNRQSPYIVIDRGWEDFWKSRPRRFRKTMRNKLNRAKKVDGLVIERIPVTSGTEPALGELLRISRNSWKKQIGRDLAAREDNWKFYKEICDFYGPGGNVFIWLLRINKLPVAFEFHIEYKATVYPIRADYDEGYKNISPGSILEYEIIKRLFSQGQVVEYNSCGHTYDYLLNWTKTMRNYHNFEVFKRNLKMKILYALEYNFLVWFRKTKGYSLYKRFKAVQNKALVRGAHSAKPSLRDLPASSKESVPFRGV